MSRPTLCVVWIFAPKPTTICLNVNATTLMPQLEDFWPKMGRTDDRPEEIPGDLNFTAA
jgi:hypothetical protein